MDTQTVTGEKKITAQDILNAIRTGNETTLNVMNEKAGFLFTKQAALETSTLTRLRAVEDTLERIAIASAGNAALLESLLALQTAKPDARGAVEFAALGSNTDETQQNLETPPGLVCPKCGEDCWDNRSNREPGDKRPLIKCKSSDCDWRQWAPRAAKKKK